MAPIDQVVDAHNGVKSGFDGAAQRRALAADADRRDPAFRLQRRKRRQSGVDFRRGRPMQVKEVEPVAAEPLQTRGDIGANRGF